MRFVILYIAAIASAAAGQLKESRVWKAGVARVVITPAQPMWMAGYGNRDHESTGTLHDLWAKALALEDAAGNRAVLVTTDLLGVPKGLSDSIRDRVARQFGLTRAAILLNSSHTHSGPVLTDALSDIYPLDDVQRRKIRTYTNGLEDQLVALIGSALQSMQPVNLFSGQGVTRFQVNRRTNVEATLEQKTDLAGPNDYAVPVVRVTDLSGKLMAVAFGYACHNTVLSLYEWNGDYAGFAQLELEKMYPGVTALFVQGAGADQNPLPRRTVALAQQYGRALAAAVDRVLQDDMQPLAPTLTTVYKEVELALQEPPTKAELERMTRESTGYQQRWARRLYAKLERGESLTDSYPYPLQVWRLGDQTLFSLGGELVIDYAIGLKRIFGQDVFVLGYSNDVMAYIPSSRILMEGGYEGESSQIVYGLPSAWSTNIEAVILYEMMRLAEQAGVPKAQ